jgi:hypothetical protein
MMQIYFAFACVDLVKKKGRLNNWWVLFAAFTGFAGYLAARRLKSKESGI